MAAPSQVHTVLTLEEFLRMPDIDEVPYLEYIDGRVETKATPTSKHNLIEHRLVRSLSDFVEPNGLGMALHEIRHTFEGRSIVPDVTFWLAENLVINPDDTPSNLVLVPPDIHVEILSPDQSVTKTHAKLLFSTSHGSQLGILIHPERKTIDVYRPERSPERLADDGAIDFAPVLPGLIVTVAEVFSWMVVRIGRPKVEPE